MLYRLSTPLRGLLLTGVFLTAGGAHAASCGTFAAPVACSLTVGGQVTYTATNFSLVSATGTRIYQASDIAIDLSPDGANAVVVNFSKFLAGPTAGIVFFANSGENANFTLRYDLTITPALPGTVAFASTPGDVVLGTSSAVGNGFSSLQLILSDTNQGVSCLAIRNINSVTSGNCALPPDISTTLEVGDLMSMFGGTGNTSVGRFENHFNAAFTAAVPEPATWALFGLGALVLGRCARRQAD